MPQPLGSAPPPHGDGGRASDETLSAGRDKSQGTAPHPQQPANAPETDATFVGDLDVTLPPPAATSPASSSGREPKAPSSQPQDFDATVLPGRNLAAELADGQRDDVTRYVPLGPVRPSTERRVPPIMSPPVDANERPAAAPTPKTNGQEGPLSLGESFGTRYHIIRVLGVGGMGAVYQAWDAELGVAVALKVIRPEIALDPVAASEIERRFKRELLLARQVTHPNIIRIHDLGDINGIKYITMPFIEGSDLATILRDEKKLPVSRALRIARGMASGLVSAHQAGVIHRDLKPANVMIAADDVPTIMDFGIARSAGGPGRGPAPAALGVRPLELSRTAAAAASSTMAGAIVGTVAYMAPEQARGEAVDQRADIYAYGLILYDMLVGGRRAERAASAIAELKERMEHAPPPPRTIDAEIPEAVDAIIRRCLEPDAANRFQTTVEVQQALDRLDDDGKPLPIIRRVSLRTLIGAVAVMLVALAGAWYYALQLVAPVEQGPVSVLISDFDNRTGDPDFNDSLEYALLLNVEDASFVNSFDRVEGRRIANRLKTDSTLNEAGARLVAANQQLNVVLAGSIAPKDAGYTVSVKAIDPANGRQLWIASDSSKSKDDVLATVGNVAADVRRRLGDRRSLAERTAAAKIIASRTVSALRSYSMAQDLLRGGKAEEALAYYQRAVEADPNFGRAHANWALAAYSLGRYEEAETLAKKALALADRMTEREKYYTLGQYYNTIARNYEKTVEAYEQLVKYSPNDAAAHNNLAIAYFKVRNFTRATETVRRAVELYPGNVTRRVNYALYAMYAGNFEAAAKLAEENAKDSPGIFLNYLPLAVAAARKNDFTAARSAYDRMAATDAAGASFADTGLADLELYQGRYAEAERLLLAGIAKDRETKNTAGLRAKLVQLAETYEATKRGRQAIDTMQQALDIGHAEGVLLPAGLMFVRAGRVSAAEEIAAELDNQLQTQTRAYAKIIDGKLAVLNRRRATAIDAFRESIKLVDTWLARFEMGIVYVQAGHHAEAVSELEACLKRQGEASAMFLDDVPTVRYLATLPYWLGRAQEGVGQQATAIASYRTFLSLRSNDDDPLVADARKRIGS